MDMTEAEIWPPDPTVSHDSTQYDEIIANIILHEDKVPLNRIWLIWALRRKTGMDLQQCQPAVKDFCDRLNILPLSRGQRAWLPPLLNLPLVFVSATMAITQVVFQHQINAAHFGYARHLLYASQTRWDVTLFILSLILLPVTIINTVMMFRQIRRHDAQARETVREWRLANLNALH
jgi:hypothetical protein